MNANDVHDLISQYYAKPVFKEWQPSEYDMKHIYNTPRRMKKLETDRAKENAKLQLVFDKALATWQKCHDAVDEIATWPEEVRDLFFNTFKWTIDDLTCRHDYVLSVEKKFIEKYGENGFRFVNDLKYLCEKSGYQFGTLRRTTIIRDVSEDGWKYFAKQHTVYVDGFGYTRPLESIADWKTYINDAARLRELWKNDAVHTEGKDAYVIAIKHMSVTLSSICEDIKQFFNGNKPTCCETDPQWGVNGKFNGILTDGITRISFKSFGAGGLPNGVQRFHYRFKCTKLKN